MSTEPRRRTAEWRTPTKKAALSRNKPNNTTTERHNTMNARTTRKLDMLKRLNRLFLDNPITPAIARATAAHAEVVNTITALEAAAQNQVAGAGKSEGGVD